MAVVRVSYREAVQLITAMADESYATDDVVAARAVSADMFVDIDGYFDPTRDKYSRVHRMEISSLQDVFFIHFLLRSALMLDLNADESHVAGWKNFSRACQRDAAAIAVSHRALPRPAWMDGVISALKAAYPGEADAIEKIDLQSVLRPQIFAHSYPSSQRIEVSATAREHLRYVNQILWSTATMQLDPSTRQSATDAGEHVLDQLLPWILALSLPEVNYSRLPVPRVVGSGAAYVARAANLQMSFVLAHEYCHLLRHKRLTPSALLEDEADDFAYQLLFSAEKLSFLGGASEALVFLSMRWFFLFAMLDRIVGATLSGYEVDWGDIPIRRRDLPLIKKFRPSPGPAAIHCISQLGDNLLFQAKGTLYDRGASWIHEQANEFQREYCRP